jgi:hypothetical protein
VTGWLLSPHKTLPGSDATPVWQDGARPSRRARPAAGCEAGWAVAGLRLRHRKLVGPAPRGRGREVRWVEGTYGHHERGPPLWGVKKRWEHGEKRQAL